MTLIELYVTEVGRRLPRRTRKDIEAELRSTLEDMLEDRSRTLGRPVDEAMVSDLLKEYGPPDKVAATYHPTQYLIGPRLYPFFLLVLKIVLSVLGAVLLVTLGFRLASEPLQGLALVRAIVQGLTNILGAGIQAFGNLALVFAILERVLPAEQLKFDEDKGPWDPASLTRAEPKPEVKLWEPITSILFTVAAMVVFNEYPQVVAFSFLHGGQWTSIPVLTDAFFHWLPYLNVLWLLQIALHLVLLRQGRWQPLTKGFSIALDLAGMVIGYLLLIGPSIARLSPTALLATGVFDAGQASALSAAFEQGVRILIALVIVVQAVDILTELIRLILRRR